MLSSESGPILGPDLLGLNNYTTEYHEGKAVYINESGFYQKKSLSLLSSESGPRMGPDLLGSNNYTTEYHEGKAVYINESGFYRLINKSKTKLADAFQTLVYFGV